MRIKNLTIGRLGWTCLTLSAINALAAIWLSVKIQEQFLATSILFFILAAILGIISLDP